MAGSSFTCDGWVSKRAQGGEAVRPEALEGPPTGLGPEEEGPGSQIQPNGQNLRRVSCVTKESTAWRGRELPVTPERQQEWLHMHWEEGVSGTPVLSEWTHGLNELCGPLPCSDSVLR